MAEENLGGEGPSEEQVNEAKSLGWAPKEEWRGAEDKWVDADEFLKRGLGIHHLRDSNKKLENTLTQVSGRLSSMEQALRAANATIAALEESHQEDTKAQVEAARAELKEQLAEANREGRHEDVADLTDKLTQLNSAEDVATEGKGGKKGGKEDKGDEPPQIHPEVVQWFKDNSDFTADKRRVALANVVAAELRQAGDTTIGKAFMEKVAEEVEKTLGPVKRGTSKAESGNGGTGRRTPGGGGKSYNDLPAEAKEACERQAKRLVGPNRAHKDIDSWRKSYTKQYFAQEG